MQRVYNLSQSQHLKIFLAFPPSHDILVLNLYAKGEMIRQAFTYLQSCQNLHSLHSQKYLVGT